MKWKVEIDKTDKFKNMFVKLICDDELIYTIVMTDKARFKDLKSKLEV